MLALTCGGSGVLVVGEAAGCRLAGHVLGEADACVAAPPSSAGTVGASRVGAHGDGNTADRSQVEGSMVCGQSALSSTESGFTSGPVTKRSYQSIMGKCLTQTLVSTTRRRVSVDSGDAMAHRAGDHHGCAGVPDGAGIGVGLGLKPPDSAEVKLAEGIAQELPRSAGISHPGAAYSGERRQKQLPGESRLEQLHERIARPQRPCLDGAIRWQTELLMRLYVGIQQTASGVGMIPVQGLSQY